MESKKVNIYSIISESVNELVVRYEAILILVGLFHDLIDKPAWQFKPHLFNLIIKLSSANFAISISVEMRKDVIKIIFSAVKMTVHTTSHKLIEIYFSVLVHIHHL